MSADTSRFVVDQITGHIQSNLVDWFGPGTVPARSGPKLCKRKWSFLIRYALQGPDGTPRGLYVKVPRLRETKTLTQAVSAAERVPYTRLEYDALMAVWSTFQREGSQAFCSVRPLAFLPGWNAIVTEELHSKAIKHLLVRPGILLRRGQDWQRLEAILADAGRWMRIFHGQNGQSELQPVKAEPLRQEVAAAVEQLNRASSHEIDTGLLQARFDPLIERIAGALAPLAVLHMDLNYANVFVTPDRRVGVMDVGAYARGPVYADLAVLICDPRTRILQVLCNGLAFDSGHLDRCKEAILKGYFGSQSYDEKLLNFYCALAIVRKWTLDEQELATARGLGRVVARWFTPYLRSYFASQLKRYIEIPASASAEDRDGLIRDAERVGFTEP